ncbi:MerR family transcriptional regulator [Sinorhizobium medicae]|uniref:Putative transcriptional regulator, MerR family n=1 Tax=Sinorhizobium medicae (strain WSM419) TaxID=366394 RepID=A6U8R9_SINMW|nr:helix-turn-helix domain-containing protein [Sinorhizobium medicae]ABR60049.1 putative transcriptional regulator, MerR family [Sinorhizobium medicae WSM419]MDX0480560.1 MerR family transcriptional regulator [Sinorhizobium medicae]MDX0838033.1 MerR family transcriptional regulator [Sinorhizobium medicae]MDX0851375.1 MerR family transcriptional regulator [Sinorhizobium medicae]MDX0898654.1 MerR family transcriptional regulator [Sinorhizobium medicae]
MLTIGELAKATGVNVSTIRYYEQMGLLTHSTRSDGNQRRYTEDEQDRLAFIRHARDLGLAITAIRDLMDLGQRPDMSMTEAGRIASEQLAAIRERIERLRKLEVELVQISTHGVAFGPDKSRVIQSLARFDLAGTKSD